MNPTLPLNGGPNPPGDQPDDGYSATVLGTHWVQGPGGQPSYVPGPTYVQGTVPETTAFAVPTTEEVLPDRVEGTLMRFGPGVTAYLAHRTHHSGSTTLPAPHPFPVPGPPRSRRLRRHVLPALVLLAALALLAWQRLTPSLTVRDVQVSTERPAPGCDETADIVGAVSTNGRPGTLTYRWIRSDGSTSGLLREELARGQNQARLHLRWTFQGEGHYEATARLRLISPVQRTVTARLTYDCGS
ncbi:hypothetical protein [Streptomyces cavernae]|uniref:hypothetical protein n=1 Tax=Streptomyces cavernae TaxID=2259034 RepID=UPI000FEBD011|nr:hypothetical protein [Streptomyces cavernae]